MKKIGFIGSGNMAYAIMGGIVKSGLVPPAGILASDQNPAALAAVAAAFGVRTTPSNPEVAAEADILFLAVKPQYYGAVIQEIRDGVGDKTLVVTIAPGWTLAKLEGAFGRPLKLVRTMPNTPALVGEGVTAMTCSPLVTPEEEREVRALLESFGAVEPLPEHLMDVVSALSGSSPAFVFMFIEAMADSAVAQGFPRDRAYAMAAATVAGSARMVTQLDRHPAALKDMVCSPGGSTIQGVRKLEEKGFRSAVFEALQACVDRAKQL